MGSGYYYSKVQVTGATNRDSRGNRKRAERGERKDRNRGTAVYQLNTRSLCILLYREKVAQLRIKRSQNRDGL